MGLLLLQSYLPPLAEAATPPIPQGLAASVISSSQIDLSWQAPADLTLGIASYHLYRDGKLIATVPQPAPPVRRRFSPDSFFNKKLSNTAPLHANSAGMVSELVRQTKVGPGIPYLPGINTRDYSPPVYIVKDPATPKVPVTIIQGGQEATWSTFNKIIKKGVRIPTGALPATGTDGELALWDQVDDVYYDFWQLKKVNGKWQASWGGYIADVSNSDGIIPVIKNVYGGAEAQGATATSLPLMGGAIFLAELQAGVIPHALGVAIVEGPNAFVYPAQRTDGGVKFFEGPNALPAGSRFRFPADIVINPSWAPIVKMIVAAVRDYGLVIRDRAGAVVLYMEDTRQYGSGDLTAPFFGGKPAYELMSKQFPWSQLQVLAVPSPAPRVPLPPIDAPPIAPAPTFVTLPYSDKGLIPGTTYSYQVAAVDAAGLESAKSAAIKATTLPLMDSTAPTVPTGVKAVAISSTQVTVSWTASTDNVGVKGYQVLSGTVTIGTSPTPSFTLSGVTQGKTYSFTVKAFDAANNYSASSTVASVTVPDTTTPTVPTSVKVVAVSSTQVKVTWLASTDNIGVTGYQIYSGTTTLGTSTALSFTLNGVVQGKTYSLTVKAYDAAKNYSSASAVVSATVPDTTAPTVPTNLKATLSGSQVNLTWTASTDNVGVKGYQVLSGTVTIGTSTTPSFTVSNVTQGKTHSFTAQAYDAANNYSAASAVVVVTVPVVDTVAPTVPANLKATLSGSQINLTWTASTDNVGVKGYQVLSGTVTIGTSTTPSFMVSNVIQGKNYSFAVKAYDAMNNYSAASTPVAATVPDIAAPSIPMGVKAIAISSAQVTISWSASTDNVGVKGYQLFCNGALLNTTTVVSYSHAGLTASTTYAYTVVAFDAANNKSAASASATSITPAPSIAALESTALPLPVLDLPTQMPVNGDLSVRYPSGYTNIEFQWTVTQNDPTRSPRQGAAMASRSSTPVASFRTINKVTSLARHSLSPGPYTITVQAFDVNGNASPMARASVTLVAGNLSSARLYPTPWRANKHAGVPVTFDRFPLGSTIKIFTVSGHRITTLAPTADSIQWNLTNSSGDELASGIYLYLITAPDGQKLHGKFAIIR